MGTDWKARHDNAMARVRLPQSNHETAIVGMLKAWRMYADAHKARFESHIGDDGVLGPEWEAIGRALLGLLNGECGALDCGTLDREIRKALESAGCNAD